MQRPSLDLPQLAEQEPVTVILRQVWQGAGPLLGGGGRGSVACGCSTMGLQPAVGWFVHGRWVGGGACRGGGNLGRIEGGREKERCSKCCKAGRGRQGKAARRMEGRKAQASRLGSWGPTGRLEERMKRGCKAERKDERVGWGEGRATRARAGAAGAAPPPPAGRRRRPPAAECSREGAGWCHSRGR